MAGLSIWTVLFVFIIIPKNTSQKRVNLYDTCDSPLIKKLVRYDMAFDPLYFDVTWRILRGKCVLVLSPPQGYYVCLKLEYLQVDSVHSFYIAVWQHEKGLTLGSVLGELTDHSDVNAPLCADDGKEMRIHLSPTYLKDYSNFTIKAYTATTGFSVRFSIALSTAIVCILILLTVTIVLTRNYYTPENKYSDGGSFRTDSTVCRADSNLTTNGGEVCVYPRQNSEAGPEKQGC